MEGDGSTDVFKRRRPRRVPDLRLQRQDLHESVERGDPLLAESDEVDDFMDGFDENGDAHQIRQQIRQIQGGPGDGRAAEDDDGRRSSSV